MLALSSLTAIGLLAYDLLSREPTLTALTGLSLVTLTTLGYALSLRRMRTAAFQTAMSTYAERQMRRESPARQPTFDAPSTVL